ncbi:MAG TPA: MerR family transcriptional regulator [Candidatus Limnocylindrales bacterium]
MPADSTARDTALLSIGEVLAQLRAEFPDTTISKLRFLETEGLVQPQRTPSGYRKYSREDVARLRYVLAAQRDQYLPLRVIRQQLDDGAHIPPPRPTLVAVTDDFVEEPASLRAPDPLVGGRAWRPQADVSDSPLTAAKVHRDELCSRSGVTPELVADLERHGLLTPTGGDWFDAEAVTVAEVAGRLAEFGIQARHLRGYRVTADREAGLLAQVVAPLLRAQPSMRDNGERELVSRARADEALRELLLLSQRLHLALLRQGLNQTLGH